MEPRFNLPNITFAEKSAQQIEADIIKRYEELSKKKLHKADPKRIFLQAIVLLLAQQRINIDYTGKQNLLSFASNTMLDHLGLETNTSRLQETKAKTTIRFTLSTSKSQIIPLGTRVTPGNGIFFETLTEKVVNVGQTSVDIEAACTESGAAGNDFLPGEINQQVDPIQWIQSVENITKSEGGNDSEDDDSYALRIRQAPESFSVAGPTGAYEYWAKTANKSIIDVSVRSPSAGVVEIRPLLNNGGIPDQEVLDGVLSICNDRKIRPLTDNVQVLAPSVVSYDINLTYWIGSNNSSMSNTIQSNVNQAIENYKLWQKSKLGRAIDPSELITLIKNAGAKRVSITSPIYQTVNSFEVAKENLSTVSYGGLEDD